MFPILARDILALFLSITAAMTCTEYDKSLPKDMGFDMVSQAISECNEKDLDVDGLPIRFRATLRSKVTQRKHVVLNFTLSAHTEVDCIDEEISARRDGLKEGGWKHILRHMHEDLLLKSKCRRTSEGQGMRLEYVGRDQKDRRVAIFEYKDVFRYGLSYRVHARSWALLNKDCLLK